MLRHSAPWTVCGLLVFLKICLSLNAQNVPHERAFVDRYCAGCHNEKARRSGRRLFENFEGE